MELTVPEGTAFDHWYTQADGCLVSDPWTANGRHQLKDIKYTPNLFIATSMPEARLEREMDGTKYRYLTANDYHLYLSDEDCEARNYTFEGTKSSDYLIKKVDCSTCYITAVVGWVPGEIPSDGAQIHNDLSGVFHDYSLVGCIAPHAFEGCTELKTLYFKDTDANNYNAQEDFHFLIGEKGFANCPNFTEMKMMQYTTKGDNTWQMIKPDQVSFVAPDTFDGSKNLKVSCHREVYQDYLSSEVWKEYIDRIMTFAKRAFQNKKNLKTVSFHENNVTTNEALPMLLTIPDSAFVGCDNLEEFSLILETDGNGQRALGPENFILDGDSIFAGLDPAKFHIKIDKSRNYAVPYPFTTQHVTNSRTLSKRAGQENSKYTVCLPYRTSAPRRHQDLPPDEARRLDLGVRPGIRCDTAGKHDPRGQHPRHRNGRFLRRATREAGTSSTT